VTFYVATSKPTRRTQLPAAEAVSKAVGAKRRRFLYQDFAAPSQKPLCGYGEKNVGFLEDVATLLYSF
jgi:hypothetical protein